MRNLADNKLKSLPPCIGNLTNLTHLYVYLFFIIFLFMLIKKS